MDFLHLNIHAFSFLVKGVRSSEIPCLAMSNPQWECVTNSTGHAASVHHSTVYWQFNELVTNGSLEKSIHILLHFNQTKYFCSQQRKNALQQPALLAPNIYSTNTTKSFGSAVLLSVSIRVDKIMIFHKNRNLDFFDLNQIFMILCAEGLISKNFYVKEFVLI